MFLLGDGSIYLLGGWSKILWDESPHPPGFAPLASVVNNFYKIIIFSSILLTRLKTKYDFESISNFHFIYFIRIYFVPLLKSVSSFCRRYNIKNKSELI